MAKKILVVDDDEAVRKSISLALISKAGYEVLEASDGLNGLELARQHIPDLIISDVIMENVNGFLMLDTLKEFPETLNIPVILMTNKASYNKEWKTGAAVEYLEKGFTLETLIEKVNSTIGK